MTKQQTVLEVQSHIALQPGEFMRQKKSALVGTVCIAVALVVWLILGRATHPRTERSSAGPLAALSAFKGSADRLEQDHFVEFKALENDQPSQRLADAYVSQAVAFEQNALGTSQAARIPESFEESPSARSTVRVAYQESPITVDMSPNDREYTLRELTLEQFETRMVEIWGARLDVSAENNGRLLRIVLPTAEPKLGAMTIDRSRSKICFEGPDSLLAKWRRAMVALDCKTDGGHSATEILDTQNAEAATIQKAVAIMETVQMAMQEDVPEVRRAISLDSNPVKSGIVASPNTIPRLLQETDPNAAPLQDEPQEQTPQQGLSGPVRVEVIPELNLLILYGKPEDVAYVQKVLANLIQSADAAQPDIEVYPLKHASGQAIASSLQTLYDNNFAAQQGPVSITALDQPNGLLLIGRPENIAMAKRLVESMDVAAPDQPEQFRTFRLKNMSAIDAQTRLNAYFGQQQQQQQGVPGAATTSPASPLTIVADYRSNSLIVKSGSANLALVEKILKELDVVDSEAQNEVRVIPVRNAMASDLAAVLQDAINGQLFNSGQGLIPQTQGFAGQGGQGAQNQIQAQAPGDPATESRMRSAMLELMTIDQDGRKVSGGILFDVRVAADANSNSLVVTGPSRCMDLITALVTRLDVVPDIEVKIKVFQLEHGDAVALLTALQSLFGAANQGGGVQNFGQQTNLQSQLPLQSNSAQNGATLAGLRFSVDERTNTLIVSGPVGDLQVIEDLIIRLDQADVDYRLLRVYRLSNAPAEDVAQTLNSYIDSRRELIATDPSALSAFEQVRREIIVVPEIVSNSLLISATPHYFAELEPVIQALDRRPAMVKVKVLLAQVTLNALDEFGVEIGLQDSLLFDRGIGTIGFPFNQSGIGNSAAAQSLATRELLAGQALSNLAIGRSNSNLGYGGLVLSAGNESINVLIRALQDRNALRVLAKPHITTVDNLLARVQVGQRVPTVTSVNQVDGGGFSNAVEYTDVGIILEITPRVSPDGTIVMLVNATNSSLGDIDAGIPIFSDANGNIIRSPIINETTAETTIMARSGQTVVLSGLMQDSRADARRGIPVLSELPVLGPLFSFDSDQWQRSELLIVMTPYLITNDGEIDAHNHVEYDRMHWCLGDVTDVYGSLEFDTGEVSIGNVSQPPVYYPDQDPMGMNPVKQDPAIVLPPEGAVIPPEAPLQPPVVQPENVPIQPPPPRFPDPNKVPPDDSNQSRLNGPNQRVPLSGFRQAAGFSPASSAQQTGSRIPTSFSALPSVDLIEHAPAETPQLDSRQFVPQPPY